MISRKRLAAIGDHLQKELSRTIRAMVLDDPASFVGHDRSRPRSFKATIVQGHGRLTARIINTVWNQACELVSITGCGIDDKSKEGR